jgi:hypothetical protein
MQRTCDSRSSHEQPHHHRGPEHGTEHRQGRGGGRGRPFLPLRPRKLTPRRQHRDARPGRRRPVARTRSTALGGSGPAPLPDFQDGRHDTGSWITGENEETLREATLAATDIVIASPLYWYSLSAQTKRYLDYWSGWLTAPGSGFKEGMAGGRLWGVTVMADDDERVADGLVTALHHSAAYLRMGFGGVLFGNGSRPGQVRDDEQALIRAKTFFERQAPLARFPHDDDAHAVTETG